jgi:hypothetical protein
MKLTKYQKEAIVRSIMRDVPKPNKAIRHQEIQDAVTKAMSPEARKLFKTCPEALRNDHIMEAYDDVNYSSRKIIIADVSKEKIQKIVSKYRKEDDAYFDAHKKLSSAIMSCNTLAQAKKMFPEFVSYMPTEEQPTKNLPALANVVADLSKLGWPKK